MHYAFALSHDGYMLPPAANLRPYFSIQYAVSITSLLCLLYLVFSRTLKIPFSLLHECDILGIKQYDKEKSLTIG